MLICSPVLHLFDKIAANNVHNVAFFPQSTIQLITQIEHRAIFVFAIKIIVTYNESFN